MDLAKRTKLVARLLSGLTPVKSGDGVYFLKEPSLEARLLAEEAYCDALAEAAELELYADEEAVGLAAQDGIWDPRKNAQLDKSLKELDELKVGLFEGYEVPAARQKAREKLADCRSLISRLSEAKWHYRDRTAGAYAAAKKARVLVGLCLYKSGQRVFGDDPSGWVDSGLIDRVVEVAAKDRPSECEIRELSRTTPWQGYWAVGKPNPFGSPAGELGDDRLALCNFSIMYDRVEECPDRPSREVLEDDDALDGWLILQKRKQGGRDPEFLKDKMIGSKEIANMQEVFVCVRPQEEVGLSKEEQIETIQSWNDFEARRVQKARAKQIAEEGQVHHVNLKDVIHDIHNMYSDMALQRK